MRTKTVNIIIDETIIVSETTSEADVKVTPVAASISTSVDVKSSPAPAPVSATRLSTSTSQSDIALAENIDPQFVTKAELLIARIRRQSELGFLRFFLKYFQELISEHTYHNSEQDLTKRVFSLDEQRKINIASNELRKALALMFAENPAILHAFDYARDQLFKENNIAYVRGVRLSDEKSVAKSAVGVPFSWKKPNDFSICRDGIHRWLTYINDNATCPIKKIMLVGEKSQTVMYVYINPQFYQNYLQAVASSEFHLRGSFEASNQSHLLVIIDTDYLKQILNFLATFDESVSVIKDEIISSVSPYIVTKARFVHWVQENDFSAYLSNRTDTTLHRSVEYMCCKENPVFKQVCLLIYKDYCVIKVEISSRHYNDIYPILKSEFQKHNRQFYGGDAHLDIPNTQILSDFLDRLATFDPDISEIRDHVICSYDPSVLQNQKTAFLMGLHARLGKKSAVRTGLASNPVFDKNVISELFSFFDPMPKQKKAKRPVNVDAVLRVAYSSAVNDAKYSGIAENFSSSLIRNDDMPKLEKETPDTSGLQFRG